MLFIFSEYKQSHIDARTYHPQSYDTLSPERYTKQAHCGLKFKAGVGLESVVYAVVVVMDVVEVVSCEIVLFSFLRKANQKFTKSVFKTHLKSCSISLSTVASLWALLFYSFTVLNDTCRLRFPRPTAGNGNLFVLIFLGFQHISQLLGAQLLIES